VLMEISLGLRPEVIPLNVPAQPWSRAKRSSARSSIAAAHAASFSTDATFSPRWRSNTPEKIIAVIVYIVGVKASEKSASALAV